MKAEGKVVELTGAVVTVNGKEINLGELTYLELGEFLEGMGMKEAQEVLEQIVEQVGEEALIALLTKLDELEAEYDEEEHKGSSLKESDEEVDSVETSKTQAVLPPVKFAEMNDFYTYDPDLIVEGIDSVSVQVGQYLAFINAGMLPKEAYSLITIQDEREHELKVLDKQIRLRELETELQVRMSGIKQVLAR